MRHILFHYVTEILRKKLGVLDAGHDTINSLINAFLILGYLTNNF